MSFSTLQTITAFVCFGRRGYNKDGEETTEETFNDAGRRGYNRGPDDEDEAEDGRRGYN